MKYGKKDFRCPYGEHLDNAQGSVTYVYNCFYFGCIHQIYNNCPIILENRKNANRQDI